MSKAIKLKQPRILKVITEEEGKKNIDSGKYIVVFIPVEDVEVE